MWQIFEAVIDVVITDEPVIIDITHGFRSLPFLSFLAAAYLRVIKNAQLEAVLYGNFEARDRTVTPNRAPVIDLTPFVGLLDWMVAADRFTRFGDARDLASLLRQAKPQLTGPPTAEEREIGMTLGHAAKALDQVSNALRLIRPAEALDASDKLQVRLLDATQTTQKHARPFAPFIHTVTNTFAPLALSREQATRDLQAVLARERAMVHWYLDRQQYVQAIAVAREWLVTWTLAHLGFKDQFDGNIRHAVERALGAEIQRLRQSGSDRADSDLTGVDEQNTVSIELSAVSNISEAVDLYANLGNARNDLLHAGKRQSPFSAKSLPQLITRWCSRLDATTAPRIQSIMIILNFSHPLTEEQVAQIEAVTQTTVTRVIAVTPQFDEQEVFVDQLTALMAAIDLTPLEWQSAPLLVVLPSLNFIAGLLLAELHGRMGYFPPVVRTRPVAGVVPRRYEIAEVLDLQDVREQARRQR